MRVFSNTFLPLFCYNIPMKLPPKTHSETDETSVSDMTKMRSLLSEKEDVIQQKDDVIESQKQRIEILEEHIRQAAAKRFAPSSEKTSAQQGNLFNEAEVEIYLEVEGSDENEDRDAKPTKKAKTGRKPFDQSLPRIQVFSYLTEEEKQGAIDVFFVKVREELDLTPAIVQILEYMQEKAVFTDNSIQNSDLFNKEKRLMKVANVVKNPVPKAMGSINLMAYIIISKYLDGLPLYRIEKIIRRYGGSISRATLANWVIVLGKKLHVLINLLREYQHQGSVIMADETRIQVLKEPGYSATGDKYMWVTLGGPPDKRSVLFDYDPSRAKEIPLRLLSGFSGMDKKTYLQTDGYAGYSAACKQYKLISVGCWDHARRKFKEAQTAQPKGAKVKTSKADMALSLINKLYLIERKIVDLSPDEKLKVREEKSLPILKKLKTWLDQNKSRVAKDSLTGKAMTYLHNQWPKLIVYCTEGELRISNILAENAIRPFVIGRKAWLFSDTPEGARASAAHYSLIETAKLHGLDPFRYYQHILAALPYAEKAEDFEALQPWNVKEIMQVSTPAS
jgi:transposase